MRELPTVGKSVVKLEADALTQFSTCLRHWASTTPEIQVLPARLAGQARKWLEQGGHVPWQAVPWIARDSPMLYSLFVAEAQAADARAGDYWHMSAALREVVERMVLAVERTLTRDVEDVDPDPMAEHTSSLAAYTLPDGVVRGEATSFEEFLWVRAPDSTALCSRECSLGDAMLQSVGTEPQCMVIVQYGEFWPRLPVRRHVQRYAFDEQQRSASHSANHSAAHAGCTKHATKPHDGGRGHGLLTAACCNCWRITGFSIMHSAESPKTVFEVLVTRLTGTSGMSLHRTASHTSERVAGRLQAPHESSQALRPMQTLTVQQTLPDLASGTDWPWCNVGCASTGARNPATEW